MKIPEWLYFEKLNPSLLLLMLFVVTLVFSEYSKYECCNQMKIYKCLVKNRYEIRHCCANEVIADINFVLRKEIREEDARCRPK